jgi:hypothetical protein
MANNAFDTTTQYKSGLAPRNPSLLTIAVGSVTFAKPLCDHGRPPVLRLIDYRPPSSSCCQLDATL